MKEPPSTTDPAAWTTSSPSTRSIHSVTDGHSRVVALGVVSSSTVTPQKSLVRLSLSTCVCPKVATQLRFPWAHMEKRRHGRQLMLPAMSSTPEAVSEVQAQPLMLTSSSLQVQMLVLLLDATTLLHATTTRIPTSMTVLVSTSLARVARTQRLATTTTQRLWTMVHVITAALVAVTKQP